MATVTETKEVTIDTRCKYEQECKNAAFEIEVRHINDKLMAMAVKIYHVGSLQSIVLRNADEVVALRDLLDAVVKGEGW